MNSTRARSLNEAAERQGPVIYWMSRDQRARDNWALLYAQEIALECHAPLAVVFCLVPTFLEATIRQYAFMLKGLEEVEQRLDKKNITFHVLLGEPSEQITRFVETHGVGTLVCDFSPLRISRGWKHAVARTVGVPLIEVDAHNIVPCWQASNKLEFGARTIRQKISRALPEFLGEFPRLRKHSFDWKERVRPTDWRKIDEHLQVDRSIASVDWIKPGEGAARQMLAEFVERRLGSYEEARNDPNKNGQSNLSPFLHFGQISAQRVALAVTQRGENRKSVDAYLEELIVRRELSDNFCLQQPHYDSFDGLPAWAQRSLNEHRMDAREFIYSREQFEHAGTHDPLWNAAQREMVTTGKMHGYMRMYWAKKILEWTSTPEEALSIAIYLNDRYELDGRDPNGYVGVAWSVGGVHDRAWTERPVFGKVRYMNFNGCKRKFAVESYIREFVVPRASEVAV